MTDIPPDLQHALTKAARVPRLLVTSDFDGTLAPIVNNPADARPLADAAAALVELADLPSTAAALISGRALDTLRSLSSMPDSVHLVGSHGAEFATGFVHDIDKSMLHTIFDTLSSIAAESPGATVELKPASVALHVRNASAADAEAAVKRARDESKSWDAELTEGKAVLEFAVISTDKGEAVDILRQQHDADAVVFFGDDVTDEKAFRRLRDGDVGVKVGTGETLARYRIGTPDDVGAALEYLARERAQNADK